MNRKKAVFNWSGGKDSAHALLCALQSGEYDIVALLTTVNRDTLRSTMHSIPLHLLEEQSRKIGIPLKILGLTPKGNMEDYSTAMCTAVEEFKQQGVTHFIYGDIFLHDIRKYRVEQLEPYGIEVVEPLWGKTSAEVIEDFLNSGLKTIVVTTMDDGLGEAAIGKLIDREFIKSLPEDYDPNGENGEYHTFCYDGPIFSKPVQFECGKVKKESFEVGMEDGTKKAFSYWFANLK